MIEKAQHNAEAHVGDAENHRQLHLERVGKGQFVFSQRPDLPSQFMANDIKCIKTELTGSMPST